MTSTTRDHIDAIANKLDDLLITTEYVGEHIPHLHEVDSVIGWRNSAGDGNPVIEIATEDLGRAAKVLEEIEEVEDLREVVSILKAGGVRCRRLV